MKTGNEIKKGLEICANDKIESCHDCPYDKFGECIERMCRDALEYINHLETTIEKLQAENSILADIIDKKEEALDALEANDYY